MNIYNKSNKNKKSKRKIKKDNSIKKNDNNNTHLIKEKIIDVLKRVDDPELGIDVHTLGLIYELKINKTHIKNFNNENRNNENLNKDNIDNNKYEVYIKMTFTTPICPYGPMLMELIESAIKEEIKEVSSVKIDITFEPPWQPSDELKTALGLI